MDGFTKIHKTFCDHDPIKKMNKLYYLISVPLMVTNQIKVTLNK